MGKADTWAVTANGSHAKIVKNLGSVESLEVVEVNTDHLKQGEIMSDKAGRVFSSHGTGRSELESHSDPVRNNELAFAAEISDVLSGYCNKKEFGSLIVSASPRTLGDLRASLDYNVTETIVIEADKDYTQLPDKDLVEQLRKLAKQNQLVV